MINMDYCCDIIASHNPGESDKSGWNICGGSPGSSGHNEIPEISGKNGFVAFGIMIDDEQMTQLISECLKCVFGVPHLNPNLNTQRC